MSMLTGVPHPNVRSTCANGELTASTTAMRAAAGRLRRTSRIATASPPATNSVQVTQRATSRSVPRTESTNVVSTPMKTHPASRNASGHEIGP